MGFDNMCEHAGHHGSPLEKCPGGRKTVFIGGSKSLEELMELEKSLLLSLVDAEFHILIGDCRGLDRSVQDYLQSLGYTNVTVYATEGKARNNLGDWPVAAIPASEKTGFAYYRQKDIAMAKDAEEMLMFWDQKSKGTYHNLLDMLEFGKPARVVLRPYQVVAIASKEDVEVAKKQCEMNA